MDTLLTQLNIMLDGLKKKEKALEELLAITENQQTVLKSELPLEEVRALIYPMNQGKQDAIIIIKECDNMFEAMLKEMGAELDAKQHLYKSQVKSMQDHIRNIMDLDVKVRVAEEENNRILDERRNAESPTSNGLKAKPTPIIADSNRVIKAYEQGSKNYKG